MEIRRLKFSILGPIFWSSISFALGVPLPTAPVNNCDIQYPPATQLGNNQTCQAAFVNSLAIYQNNVQVWTYISSTDPDKKATVDDSGRLILPIAPVNDCNQHPTGSAAFTQCNTNFENNSLAFQKARDTYNTINTQMATAAQLASKTNQLNTQQSQQAAAGALLEINNENSATSSLKVVQKNNSKASDMYSVSEIILTVYKGYNENEGQHDADNCSGTDYDSCAEARAGFAAAAAFTDMKTTAHDQIVDFATNRTEVCKIQNKLSEEKVNCDFTTPTSSVAIPAIAHTPNTTWFDPFTAQCRSSAPELCKEILNVINSGGSSLTIVLPKLSWRCPDGSTTCVSSEGPKVEATARGNKYTYKDKKGKAYIFYASDFKSEKAMIAAGLTAAQAKKLKTDLEKKVVEVNAVAKKVAKKLSEVLDEEQGNQVVDVGVTTKKPTVAETANAQALKQAAQVDRRPSSEGLTRNLNGDLIGVAKDNIFQMINRRYIRKTEMNWFYTP